MAYVYCHNCGWEQDDWWSEHYTPLDYEELKKLNNDLLAAIHDPSKRMSSRHDSAWLEERFDVKHEIDVRVLIANKLERMAVRILTMHFWTEKEFQADRKCPDCGSTKHMNVD